MRLGIIASVLVVVVLAVAGCGDGDNASNDGGKIKVVTTLPLFADFVRQIGGDRVEVTSLVPTGADPHTWETSPSDVRRVAEAEIAFANGLDLEPAAINVIEANLKDGATLIILSDPPNKETCVLGCNTLDLPKDPHLWVRINGGFLYADRVATSLIDLDPDAAASYEANRKAYFKELQATSGYVQARIRSIPAHNRKLITTHDAFQHIGSELQVIAFVAQSPGQEPTPEDVANLARAIEREGVPAVFGEPQIGEETKILQQAAEDAGVQVCTLYSDSLDDRVTSYIELMRFNADELARCLGGDG